MSPQFSYADLLPIGEDKTKYRNIGKAGVSVIKLGDREFLQVEPEALTLLSETAIHDISHYLRAEHLQQLANILKDPEASPNDRFVALDRANRYESCLRSVGFPLYHLRHRFLHSIRQQRLNPAAPGRPLQSAAYKLRSSG